MGIAEILKGDKDICEWKKLWTGAICYVKDHLTEEITLRLIDPGYSKPRAEEKWRLIL